MKTATTIVQWLIRVLGVIMLVLGLLFWSGNALALIPVHTLLGMLFVLLLWVMAGLSARAGVGRGRVALAIAWGFVVPALGMMQSRLLPGSAHWVIQVLHLLVGVAAIGQAEGLAGTIKRAHAPQQSQVIPAPGEGR